MRAVLEYNDKLYEIIVGERYPCEECDLKASGCYEINREYKKVNDYGHSICQDLAAMCGIDNKYSLKEIKC